MSESVDLTKPVRIKSTKAKVFPGGRAKVHVTFEDGTSGVVALDDLENYTPEPVDPVRAEVERLLNPFWNEDCAKHDLAEAWDKCRRTVLSLDWSKRARVVPPPQEPVRAGPVTPKPDPVSEHCERLKKRIGPGGWNDALDHFNQTFPRHHLGPDLTGLRKWLYEEVECARLTCAPPGPTRGLRKWLYEERGLMAGEVLRRLDEAARG